MGSISLRTESAMGDLFGASFDSQFDQSCHHEGTFRIAGSLWRTTPVFDTYWRFATARQAIYRQRLSTHVSGTNDDPILMTFKFTNAYRAADRVSQSLIREVIYDGRSRSIEDTFFRIILFKMFNKIETWERLRNEIGEIQWKPKVVSQASAVLNDAITRGKRIYSAAYIMPSGGGAYPRKHEAHLALLTKMMDEQIPSRIRNAANMSVAFNLLRSQPMLGDFLAYQFATDLNYSDLCNFSEREFVVAGPGARDGLRKCFPDLPMALTSEAIATVCDAQSIEFEKRNLTFQDLWGRPLQLIDCQNLFCEVDKYARVAHPKVQGLSGRTKIKQQYRTNGALPPPFFPPKWQLSVE